MSQLTGKRVFNALKGLLSGLDSTDEALLKNILGVRKKVRVQLGDGGATATSVGAIPFYTNDSGATVRVVKANLLSPVTIAPGATNNVAFTVSKVDSAGANAETVATWTSNVAGGTATADVPKALTVTGGTSTAAAVADGWTLRIAAAKGGSGVPIADGEAQAVVEVTLDYEV